MKPERHFRFKGKKEIFAAVAFRYDRPTSLLYQQYKEGESVAGFVRRMLADPNLADVISIRRVYLDASTEAATDDPPKDPLLEASL